MYLCIINDNFVNAKAAQKYIKIDVTNENSIDKFIKEVFDADIHSKLEPNLNTDPNHNYEILAKHLQLAKNKHIPQKIKKFNKRKHAKEKWMTQELLAKIVKKIHCMLNGKPLRSLMLLMTMLKKVLKIVKGRF